MLTPLQPLVPVPAGDPRPDPMGPEVINRAIVPFLPEVLAWAEARYPIWHDGDVIRFALNTCIRNQGADAFRVGVLLTASYKVPVDFALVKIIDRILTELPTALRRVVGEWCMRTALRFPGGTGDRIVYLDEGDIPRTGVVKAVDRALGCAIVDRPEHGLTRVCIEQVIQNRSQGWTTRADLPKREIGFTHPDADGIGRRELAAFEARRAAGAATPVKPTLTVVPDGDGSPPLIA